MNMLGNGLFYAQHYEDTLSVKEAELSMRRRLGDSAHNILVVQSNLGGTYQKLGRLEDALRINRDVYSGQLKLNGEGHVDTCLAAFNCATNLSALKRFDEIKELLPRIIPVARRSLGESHGLTLKMRSLYATVLCVDRSATLADLREAVETLEETERTARRVFGGAHPTAISIAQSLRAVREARRARESPNA